MYDDTGHEDPLEDYIPYNDVHKEAGSQYAGNFRYDITQWNNVHDPDKRPQVDHRDQITLGFAVKPDLVENEIMQFCAYFTRNSWVLSANML